MSRSSRLSEKLQHTVGIHTFDGDFHPAVSSSALPYFLPSGCTKPRSSVKVRNSRVFQGTLLVIITVLAGLVFHRSPLRITNSNHGSVNTAPRHEAVIAFTMKPSAALLRPRPLLPALSRGFPPACVDAWVARQDVCDDLRGYWDASPPQVDVVWTWTNGSAGEEKMTAWREAAVWREAELNGELTLLQRIARALGALIGISSRYRFVSDAPAPQLLKLSALPPGNMMSCDSPFALSWRHSRLVCCARCTLSSAIPHPISQIKEIQIHLQGKPKCRTGSILTRSNSARMYLQMKQVQGWRFTLILTSSSFRLATLRSVLSARIR